MKPLNSAYIDKSEETKDDPSSSNMEDEYAVEIQSSNIKSNRKRARTDMIRRPSMIQTELARP